MPAWIDERAHVVRHHALAGLDAAMGLVEGRFLLTSHSRLAMSDNPDRSAMSKGQAETNTDAHQEKCGRLRYGSDLVSDEYATRWIDKSDRYQRADLDFQIYGAGISRSRVALPIELLEDTHGPQCRVIQEVKIISIFSNRRIWVVRFRGDESQCVREHDPVELRISGMRRDGETEVGVGIEALARKIAKPLPVRQIEPTNDKNRANFDVGRRNRYKFNEIGTTDTIEIALELDP